MRLFFELRLANRTHRDFPPVLSALSDLIPQVCEARLLREFGGRARWQTQAELTTTPPDYEKSHYDNMGLTNANQCQSKCSVSYCEIINIVGIYLEYRWNMVGKWLEFSNHIPTIFQTRGQSYYL